MPHFNADGTECGCGSTHGDRTVRVAPVEQSHGWIDLRNGKAISGSAIVYVPTPLEVGTRLDILSDGFPFASGIVTACDQRTGGDYMVHLDFSNEENA